MAKKPARPRLRLTDTTFRDGNQTLLGGQLRGSEIYDLARAMDGIGFYSLEAFGGATFETYLRLGEDPWQYLRSLHEAAPRTPIQALVRGQNLVGHRNYADDTVELFVAHAARCGVGVFRFFDPLNDLRNMEVAVAAAKKAGCRVQGALCYAISPAHDLDLWCSLAKGLAAMGCDEVVVKDTSGLLSPQVTWELVTALRESVELPIGVHSHCSSGMAPMAYMAAVEAGAAILDTALSPLAWGASQPATESVVAALAGGDYDTGLDLGRLVELKDQLEAIKQAHLEHLSPLADRVDSDILRHQLPGLMLQDVYRQLQEHEARERLREVLDEIPRVRKELGYPPLVAPLRQVVATQAVYNVIGGERYATVTQELKDYLQGLYGRPPVPADAEVRRLVLGREEPITIRPADLLEPQVEAARAQLRKLGFDGDDGQVLTFLLFPALATRLFSGEMAAAPPGGDGSRPEAASSGQELAPEGQEEAQGEAAAEAAPQAEGAEAPGDSPAAAEFEVEVEGEVFRVRVSGSGVAVGPAPARSAAPSGGSAPTKAAARGTAIVAPMQGLIVKLPVKEGDEVKLGDVVAVLEAMKMQNDIVSTVAGKVAEVHVKEGDVVSPNQAILSVG